jgi:hypothetical protein
MDAGAINRASRELAADRYRHRGLLQRSDWAETLEHRAVLAQVMVNAV